MDWVYHDFKREKKVFKRIVIAMASHCQLLFQDTIFIQKESHH